ncbi:putative methyltransferase with RNA binding domain [Tepidanaerobacter acetatoxydans Re1]|uniref:Putative methyltransferase with RNA binding domain n=1 Tax=Tepidanaerobacter acetatoxydans (strain DSM 21804 / JCM 16047 / Re1) TaxID=1209989 RepID=F4LV11_TEPAE|nr:TlyA family RNA methyltransferase [Tepidanaerobacter acetatoxydans]AEE91537.1 hemolysin A [Tepidanaerobacter acetatoxydans Re1]CCP26252.1 putative methyltransferase with RNA binding domain [Tepidanaerobacter acetatoxydans Re1]
MSQNKQRLDVLLVNKGMVDSREKAKAEIMCGNVIVNAQIIDKPGTLIDVESNITIKKKSLPYVSRGGLKLEKALELFNIKVKDKIVLDAGASTGGFTDCMLKKGAKKVYAVDVGYGQLAYSLREDVRVVVLERKNVRYLSFEDIGEKVDIITADLSFISLSKVFEPFYKLLNENGDLITLIKPQFEVGREDVGKKGVVKDFNLHVKAINKIISNAAEHNFFVIGLTFSPIKGPKGNIEYLAHFRKDLKVGNSVDIEDVVKKSHLELL